MVTATLVLVAPAVVDPSEVGVVDDGPLLVVPPVSELPVLLGLPVLDGTAGLDAGGLDGLVWSLAPPHAVRVAQSASAEAPITSLFMVPVLRGA
ncbi:MAG: hypothetical protein L0H96_19630 [Humibacillus sp.]|nr:hypothetical protein [Humibacillus sp.]MDN5779108.1 hypothetical protein [Humibacillus sp.]